MKLNEYQVQAMKTCTESSHNLSYMLLNLVGEVGEFSSKIAKGIRKGTLPQPTVGEELDADLRLTPAVAELIEGLKLEAGDVLWQLAGLCSVMGWSLEDIAKANIDKLQSRQQRNTIVGDGDYR